MLYSQGENSWTWPHWRTECAMSAPASSTIGRRPRSRICAAAARPTGPAPMIATVLALAIVSSYDTRNIEFIAMQKLRRLGIVILRGIGAAFGDQKIHQPSHYVVIGVTDQGGGIPDLIDQSDHHKRFDVVGQRGGRDFQLVLQAAHSKPRVSGANKRAVNLEPGRITQGFEMGGGVIQLHDGMVLDSWVIVNYISSYIEIIARSALDRGEL